jgi:sarcosine oxidase
MRDFDVIVIGLGAWGSAALYHLARNGHRALGIDRFEPPHDRGSHHGNGRVIRMASPESPLYTPLMQRSYALWSLLEEEWGSPLIAEVGGLYIGPSDHEFVAGALASYEGTRIPHEILSPTVAKVRYPWLTVNDGETVVYEPGAGVISPEQCIRAHLGAAVAAGATIKPNSPVDGWTADRDGVTISSAGNEFRAGRAVFTMGSWSPDHLRLALPLTVERQVVAVYDASARDDLAIFTAPADEAECVYGLPEASGTYKVALHHGGEIGHPDTLSAVPSDRDLALIEKYVRQRLPDLPRLPIRAAVCRYTNTPDHHFVLGPHPRHGNVLMASGCSGRGYKFAAVIGEILADLCEGECRNRIDLFDPMRF